MMVKPAVVSRQMLQEARALGLESGVDLIACLQRLGGLEAEQAERAVSELFGYAFVQAAELKSMQPQFSSISYAESLQHNILVTKEEEGGVTLVLTDPFDGAAETWALRRLERDGIEVGRIVLTKPYTLQTVFSQLEHDIRAMDTLESNTQEANDEDVAAVITLASINDDSSPVVKLVNSTIYDAMKMQVSDVHLECDVGCLHVQYRVDGVLVPIKHVQGQDMAEQIVSRIKVMADLDIAERRIPQDGRFKVRINEREVDFRVSVMPNIYGEDAVLRLLDRQSLTEEARTLRLDHLGLDRNTMDMIRRLAAKPHGMLLVTGPTGSGKTTTLYAAITEIHTGRDKIVTIEDPVEYRLPRVLQIPVNEKKGLTFARGLRSILRHDPDKIMVGEIRDDETAQIAVQAALTGHLVFTTVHANSVFDVVGRFLHMGVDAYSFASALNGIVAQRLIRINCAQCSKPTQPYQHELDALGLDAFRIANWKFMAGKGCPNCRGTGYKGRKAAAEVLILNDLLRELIADRAPFSQLKAQALKAGLHPLQNIALDLAAAGETTLEEVIRVAG